MTCSRFVCRLTLIVNLNQSAIMKVLIVDTETTGLPVKGDEYSFEQPFVVQLAGVLFDIQGEEIEKSINTLIIPPQGVIFHEKATQVHGFTEEVVRANGRDAKEVYDELRELRKEAQVIAAYNWEFDERLIRTSSVRIDESYRDDPVCGTHGKDILYHCVMKQAMTYFKHPRQKLATVYKTLMGENIQNAHDAMADAVAAMHVMKQLLLRQLTDN